MRTRFVLGILLAVAAPSGLAKDAPLPAAAAAPASILPTPQFRRYGAANGIPTGSMYAVAQDHKGLMWFAGSGGLIRFDGVDFKAFRHSPTDSASLPANDLFALFVDRADRVWAGGITTGLSAYEQTSGHFENWHHDPKVADSLVNNEVWSIAQTADGRLWIATQDGLDRMLPDRRGFEHMTHEIDGKPTSFGVTRALLAEDNGRLWIGTETGLYLREADGSTRRVPIDPGFAGESGMVWHIGGGGDDVRVAVSGGLLVVGADGVARPVAAKALASARVLSSARDRQGRLWMGSLTGLLLQDGARPLQHIGGQALLPGGLPTDPLWKVFRDHEGGIWLTFDQFGIAYLAPGWTGFARYTHIPDDPASLQDTAALTVSPSRDGKLWVGGTGWVDKLDPVTGAVEHVVRKLGTGIFGLLEDTQGRLWMATPGQVYVYAHGRVRPLNQAAGTLRPNALAEDAQGRLYVSSWGEGVLALDPERLTTRPLVPAEALGDTGSSAQMTTHDGQVWYASLGGLLRIDEQGHIDFVPGIPRQEIQRFGFDPDGGVWLLTDHAIDHYRLTDGVATAIDHVDLSDKSFVYDVRGVRVDRQGGVWLLGDPGLWRFDPATRRFTRFGPSQGLTNAEFSNGSSIARADGSVFAATAGGVMGFDPATLVARPPPQAAPPLAITDLAVRRDGHMQALTPGPTGIDLHWDDRDLRVSVRLASYLDPAANRYRFWLHGVDSGWVAGTSQGQRDFSALRAGTYTLEVNAAGADGKWHALAQPLHISMQAPPWVRWWAWTLYVLLAATLIAALLLAWRRRLTTRHHLQMLDQQRQMAETANAAKTRFLATLSHEIRTPMTGVMGMAELLLGTSLTDVQRDYTRAMQRSGAMLLKLLNDALDLSRIEAGRLQLDCAPFDPRELLDEVIDLESGQAQLKGIALRLDAASDLPALVVGDVLRIKQILLNLANNALKFTEHGSVTLSAQAVTEGLMFSISDTGPGIPEASRARLFQRFEQLAGPQRASGSGLGLAICRELVNLMDGSIELESRLGGGSTFRVRLPLPAPAASVGPARADLAHVQHCRVLLVEDDVIVAAVIRGLLQAQGHAVCHVINGLAALAELAHSTFDVVLLDLDLPGVDGFQIARLIRQRESAGRHQPIVAVTARSGRDDEAQARAAGMDGFLRKPLTGEQLAEALARALRQAEATPG
jgi:signal transduction histidine kinase/ligand-binding sensor domain-containing protein/CheY-like chemotaxis protein